MRTGSAAALCALLIQPACSSERAQEQEAVNVSVVDGVLRVHVASLAPDGVAQWSVDEIFTTAAPATRLELFQVTGARFLENGTLALANSGTGEILVIDTLGTLLRRMGGKGAGPGEFTWISGLDVDTSGHVIAYDPRQGRLTRLTSDGAVVETRPLAPPNRVVDLEPITFLSDGRVAAVYGDMRIFAASGERRDTTPLMLFDAEGARADTIGMWPATEWSFISLPNGASRAQVGFGGAVAYAGRNGRFAIGSTDTLNIAVYDDAVLAMRIGGGQSVTVEAADVERWREDLLARRAQAPEEIRRALAEVPYRSTYPAFHDLVVDDDGRVWIASSAAPAAAERHWLVIGRDGAAAGRLMLPAATQVLDAAGDRIAVLSRDELDEEYIAVLRITRQ